MTLYCGIDLHSTNSFVAILDQQLRLRAERRVRNDLSLLVEFLKPHQEELSGVAVESTFNSYWLLDGLADAGYRCHLANPWAAKQYSGLKYTDDRSDARWLARLLALGILPEGYIYPREDRGLRDLLRRRSFLVHKRTSMELSMMGLHHRYSGRQAPLQELREWSKSELPLDLEDDFAGLAVGHLGEVARVIGEQIHQIEKEVLAQMRPREGFRRLKTIPGIGDILSLTILLEVGRIERFRKVGNFVSYCRLARSEHLSNGKTKGSGNRRNGNAYLSWAFSEAAEFARRFNPKARRYYDRKRSKCHLMVARRALANKMARIVYRLMRHEERYDPKRAFV